MRLVAKILGLSFIPKKLDDFEAVKKEVEKVKTQVLELEEGR
jgi:hypothetical protein